MRLWNSISEDFRMFQNGFRTFARLVNTFLNRRRGPARNSRLRREWNDYEVKNG